MGSRGDDGDQDRCAARSSTGQPNGVTAYALVTTVKEEQLRR